MKATADAVGARWLVLGAQAAIIWGRARTTADLDATIELELDRLDDLRQAARKAGLAERAPNTRELVRARRVLLLESPDMPVDLSLAASGLERLFMERARQVKIGGLTVPVLSPEDLIVTKVLAFRPRDVDDVLGILGERDDLDLDYIASTLALVQEAVEGLDLLGRWQDLRAKGRL